MLVMSDEEAAVEKLSVVGGGFTGEGVEMISLARLATATPEAQGAGAEVDDAFAGGFKSKVFSQVRNFMDCMSCLSDLPPCSCPSKSGLPQRNTFCAT